MLLIAADAQSVFERVLLWSAVLAGLLVLAYIAIAVARRRQQGETTIEHDAPPFSLHELRKLHREGKLTDEEYERARDAMIGAMASVSRRPAEPDTTESADSPDADDASDESSDPSSDDAEDEPPTAP